MKRSIITPRESPTAQELECYRIVREIPNDVWKIIFGMLLEESEGKEEEKLENEVRRNSLYGYAVEPKKLETEFKKLCCVSNSWSLMISELVRINFKKFQVTNWSLFHNQNIEVLNLSENNVVVNETIVLLTNLKKLNLTHYGFGQVNKITSSGIRNLTSLSKLNLCMNKEIDDECLLNLSNNLKSLNLADNKKISNECVMKMTNLEAINVRGSIIQDSGLIKLTNLSALQIDSSCQISDESVKTLTRLTKLMTVGDLITNHTIQKLGKLRTLGIYAGSQISYAGFSNLRHLSTLKMFNDYISDNELQFLTNLTSLEVSGYISNKSIEKLTKLSSLSICWAENVDIAGICGLSLLTRLSVGDKFGDEEVKNLNTLIELEIPYSRSLSDEGIKNLTNLKSLIYSKRSKVTSNGLKLLTKLVHIKISY
jgi:hypothetical protein